MSPGPLDGLALVAMGVLAIVFRRYLAANKPLPWGRTSDEVFGVDVRVLSQVTVGVIAIIAGLAAFLIWATA
jgi:hypothetical protein